MRLLSYEDERTCLYVCCKLFLFVDFPGTFARVAPFSESLNHTSLSMHSLRTAVRDVVCLLLIYYRNYCACIVHSLTIKYTIYAL